MVETIGEKIRKLRRQKNLKQADFVASLDVDRSYLSQIENNKKIPGRELLIKMSKELNVSLDWLTSEQDHKELAKAQNEDEAMLLYAYRNLPEDEAQTILKLLLQRTQKENKKNNVILFKVK